MRQTQHMAQRAPIRRIISFAKRTVRPVTRTMPRRIAIVAAAQLLLFAELIGVVHHFLPETSYALGNSSRLLSAASEPMAKKLVHDSAKATFSFNASQSTLSKENRGLDTTNQAKATLHEDGSKGVTVDDPSSSTSFTMKPKFGLANGRKDSNRVVYPLRNGHDGWLVYSMHAVGAKEDIILTSSPGNTTSYSYDLALADGQEARLEADGSVGVYANDLFSGQVSTGTPADAKILENARKNAPKNKRIFTIPAPTIVESKNGSRVEARFSLGDNGRTLTVNVSQLDQGVYPLSIDPSIYIVTAQQFMQGNNETNIDFNVSDKLIQKGKTTGARFDTWEDSAVNLSAPSWSGASTAAGGYMYQVGGTTFNGQTFTAQGSNTYKVPTGITTLTFKAWGGGGGSGAGAATTGGNGGGGGYIQSTISVTPGETLNVYIGGGGSGGIHNALGSLAGGGGSGGGFTSVYRGSTPLLIAAGGAGGGGSRESTVGGAGGAGGGTQGANGTAGASGNGNGGGGGSQTAGGIDGANTTGSGNSGTNGSFLVGGSGGDGRSTQGADGSGAIGGGASGGNGGAPNINITRAGGGGGGGGYYGGSGGGGSNSTTGGAGGGGGGGSNYFDSGSTSVTNTLGSGRNPGNNTDTSRNNAGTGGAGGLANNNGSGGSGGALLITNGAGGSSTSSSLSWSHLNNDDGTIEGADPGNGVCSGFCTTSAYNLPAPRKDLSLVAYNGFLYAIGGVDDTGARSSTVYVAKLGANGEPRRWHPTSTNQTTWDYWHTTTTLSSSRSLTGAVAYNNRLYLVGGLTGTGSGTPVSTVEYADINPTGTLGSWTTSTSLTTATYGHTALTYNDRLYVIGGATGFGGSPVTTTSFVRLATDGSLTGAWRPTTPLPTGRMSGGGQMGSIWGAYLYVSGGCTAQNASGYCTTIGSNTQVASINADGTVGVWNTVGTVTSQRTGASLVTWRNRIYHIGGCSSQNATSGSCDSAILGTISKGTINRDGDASTVGQSSTGGVGSCNAGTASTNCDTPSTVGNMLNASVITKGYLYVIGGCTSNTCNATSTAYAYAAISSTGVTSRPSACSGTYVNNIWCTVTASNQLTSGVAASSPVVFNERIYLIGGLNGTANTNSIDRATVNADGSLGTWTRQTMTGADTGTGNQLEAQSYLFAYARANPNSSADPGNLFIFGGCTASSAAGCTDYSPDVHKCNIELAAGAIADCSTTDQLQIGTLPGATSDGLGLMSGTVYANYVYLIGGVGGNLTDLDSVRYAKIDNSNNVVAVSGTTWLESSQHLQNGRRRAAGFGYNGYLYVVGGFEANSGVLADIEFIKINVSDGSLDSSGFKESAVTINQRWGLSVPISNSYAYVIGGCIVGASPGGCTSRTNVVQTFQIYNNDSGAPAGYSINSTNYNAGRIAVSATISNGYLYIAGGCTSPTDCTIAESVISYAPFNEDGTLGSFAVTTAYMPQGRAWGKLVAIRGTLYYVGGQTNLATDEQSAVFYATPNVSTGDISAWSTATNGLPAARTKMGAAVWNDRIYIVGGLDANAAVTNTVYISPQLTGTDISSAWTTSTAFNVARSGLMVAAYANNLYLFGGNVGSTYLSDSQVTKINPTTGLVGSWNYSTSLPGPLTQGESFAHNGYMYILGGRSNDTTCNPVTLVAPVSANTTISSGNNPTGIGEWYETNQRYTGARYGASAVYTNGKAYIIGGACGSPTLTYAPTASSIQYSTLLSQPQVAKYSIAIDTDTDVTPNSWLLNGIDNSIGARWQLNYRSMPNTTTSCTSPAMTTWGQNTAFGNVTLGQPGVYTPKNASGVSTNCARFYYFNVSVDSSRAFGYPDDVSRGPTITDLTLQFTADPSKRLMHGRTFTGGLQQPIDTPYYQQ